MTDDIELPEIPDHDGMIDYRWYGYKRMTVESYARTAVLADRDRRAQPAPGAEAQRLIHGFMLDCNAIGLQGAAENLHRGIKQVAAHHATGEGE